MKYFLIGLFSLGIGSFLHAEKVASTYCSFEGQVVEASSKDPSVKISLTKVIPAQSENAAIKVTKSDCGVEENKVYSVSAPEKISVKKGDRVWGQSIFNASEGCLPGEEAKNPKPQATLEIQKKI